MVEITRERLQEVLDRRNWGGFWEEVSMLDRSGLPRDVRDAGTNWDRMVAALTRWRDSLPETLAPEVVDVPQPAVTVVKQCEDVTARLWAGSNYVLFEDEVYVHVPVALVLAMADAIRARGGQ